MRVAAALIALVIGFPAFANHAWYHAGPPEQAAPYHYSRDDDDLYHTNHLYGLGLDSFLGALISIFSFEDGGDVFSDETQGIGVAWMRSSDGVGRYDLVSYLREDARHLGVVKRWDDPPVIRFQYGTSQETIDATLYTVQTINSALPRDWQISIDFDTVFRSPSDPIAGEILIGSREQWKWPAGIKSGCSKTNSIGCAKVWRYESGEVTRAGIMVDPTQPDEHGLRLTLSHEILHALGRDHPINLNRSDTIMSYNHFDSPVLTYPIDREALYAVYGRLDVGTKRSEIHEDLGPWESTSHQLLGIVDVPDIPTSTVPAFEGTFGDVVMFGVRTANGHSHPWVLGPEPSTYVWENPELIGNVSWSGSVVGFTHISEPVIGDTRLVLDLSTLDGDLDFTGMRQWPVRQMPVLGTGSRWGDGDLHYSVQIYHNDMDSVFANIDPQAGDDYGIVDGGFFGAKHEAMGGTLVRDDLTAAFGGKR